MVERFRIYLRLILPGLAILAGCLFVACADDDEMISGVGSVSLTLDESDIIEEALEVSVNGYAMSVGSSTRAEEPTADAEEIMSDFEKQVDNIWVFQYGTDGNLLIKPRYYLASESETEGIWSVLLKPVASTIYVVTNVNSDTWVSSADKFGTATLLLASTLPEPYTIYDLSETATEGHIPMKGCVEGVTPGSEEIIVPVEHMYAKVKVRVIIDQLLVPYDPVINSVYAENCPWYCQIGTLYDETTNSQNDKYPTGSGSWVERSMMTSDGQGNEVGNNINDPNNEGLEEPYDYVIYIPENIQGEVSVEGTDADAKSNNLPSGGHPTSIVVDLKYTNSRGAESEKYYTVYPGGNSYNNFNIRRNQVYRVTMTLGFPDTESTPSANCIVAHPGKTVSFEPYYRVETGGGYNFLEYISPNSDEGSGAQIKSIRILWQTEDCIGDNSAGNLVYFEASDPQDLHDKIYVTAKAPGNAVIAAYDNEDYTQGNIIWSWHIWVTSEDPTNISNAITYYTYPWDESGIYGYGNSEGRARVPGYGMMSCNLGALASEPTATTGEGAVITYGMLYQWGRKDPFPALKGAATGSHGTSYTEYGAYNENTTEWLWDNDYNRITGMTDEADPTVLFHSVTATEILSNGYDVPFSIQNPTVFMCGTYLAAQHTQAYVAGNNTNDSYTTGRPNYPDELGGDWKVTHDERLWGADAVNADTKYLAVGTDRDGDIAHLYDDYGEKSIFDPCPYGWRVSPPDQWLGFTIDGLNPSSSNYTSNINYDGAAYGYGLYLYIQDWRSGLQSYFPTQGTRAPDGSGGRPIRCGNYHNATADAGEIMQRVNILHIHNGGDFNMFELGIVAYYVKSVAGPVRCVRDTK